MAYKALTKGDTMQDLTSDIYDMNKGFILQDEVTCLDNALTIYEVKDNVEYDME